MSGARRKVPLKRKVLSIPEGDLPQLDYTSEKPEWHRSILQIKGSTSLLKKSFRPFEEKEVTSEILSKGLTAEERQWLKYEYYLRKLIPTETVAPLTMKNVEKNIKFCS
ncbi:dynein heavy chain 7, axonemal [Caerostris extrusa]|uniref:Dynein heavy chain 7, axonemal n=1 Tax=Caerostris extrusa TaxID=172846 RepID=A0AAV4TZB8_CAEEX|nr:dynein heavy chain 7, axonemal [Caerostris extrusa]